jgi:uncharacterized membrane protein YedE/YeeE
MIATSATCGMRCRVMSLVLAGAAGVLFGVGLLVAGMTRPDKIIAFLDVLGDWDPALMFVMAGGIAAYAPALLWIRARRSEPWFDVRFHIPTRRDIDLQLLLGAAIFGVGWGLGGLCPGPAIVSLAGGGIAILIFVAAMLVGLRPWRP